ncbi:MAG: porin family protein [Gemmatimonadaceae bacterium]
MNRRTILIASALFLTVGTSTAFAQDMDAHPSFGLLAGVNFASLRGSDAANAKTRTGFVGGLSMNLHVARHVGIEVDGLYSQEGAKFNAQGGDETLKLDYIRVPVLLRLGIPTQSSVHPFVVVGPSLGFKVGCKETLGSDSANCDSVEGLSVKSFDFAGAVGGGVGFRVGKEELSVQARYTMGFSKIIDNSDAKNKNFSVMAGFAF